MNVLERLQQRLAVNMQNEQFKQTQSVEFANAVDEFKCHYSNFFNGDEIQDYVTQNYWYGMYLGKRRLDKLRLHKQVKFMVPKYRTVTDVKDNAFSGLVLNEDRSVFEDKEMIWNTDGKSLAVEVRENISTEVIYEQNGNKIGQFHQDEIACFSVVESANTKDQYVCPNCGGVNSTANLIDGCDFCGSKFEVKDFKKKIAGFFIHPDLVKGAVSGMDIIKKIIPVFIVSVFVIVAIGMISQTLGGGVSILSVTMNLVSVIMPFLVYGMFAFVFLRLVLSAYKKKARATHTPVMNAIHQNNPDFTIERFWSSMEYKLKALHFAENPFEIKEYCEFNCAPMIAHYGNVINCEYKDGYLMSYQRNGNEQQVRAAVVLKIDRLLNGRIRQTEEKVSVAVKTDAANGAMSMNDAIMYRCPNCGNTISLLNGGVCESCGSALDLSKYDWVLSSYQITGESKPGNAVWWLYLIAIVAVVLLSVSFLIPLILPLLFR